MIERVAIIGAGGLGSRLALASARAGFRTTLEDVLPSSLRRAVAGMVEAGADPALVRYATSVEDAVRDADLILDCVPDELESKLEIFSLLDRMAPPQAIFATPTNTLSIADLASCTYRAERCIAVSFDEAELTGRVTLTYPPHASDAVLRDVAEFWRRLGAEVALREDLLALP
jgi:3-hydroxybutyryl-CoA dehydrogenase